MKKPKVRRIRPARPTTAPAKEELAAEYSRLVLLGGLLALVLLTGCG